MIFEFMLTIVQLRYSSKRRKRKKAFKVLISQSQQEFSKGKVGGGPK